MSMERGRTEVGASGETSLHHNWQLNVVPIHESTASEGEDRRPAITGWMLVIVDLTGLLILGVRLFAEEPPSHEIADAFESIRNYWDDREPDDEFSLPLTLVLGSGLWERDATLRQRRVARGTDVVGPVLDPPVRMPRRAAEYLQRKAKGSKWLSLTAHSSRLRRFLEDTAPREFNGKSRSEREEILRDLEWHSPCAAGVPRKPRQLRKAG